jgi:hypothetical protein
MEPEKEKIKIITLGVWMGTKRPPSTKPDVRTYCPKA